MERFVETTKKICDIDIDEKFMEEVKRGLAVAPAFVGNLNRQLYLRSKENKGCIKRGKITIVLSVYKNHL